jgi:hypothetical protein
LIFDETHRLGEEPDFTLSDLADHLRQHMLNSADPLSESKWRLAGYRFAKALSQGRQRGYELTREFIEGMRIFIENHDAQFGSAAQFDVARADAAEAKAEKLIKLASHPATNDHEARAAIKGFIALLRDKDVIAVAHVRYESLKATVGRLTQTINFLRSQQPHLLLWKPSEKHPEEL